MPTLLLLLIMLLCADCMLTTCAVSDRCLVVLNKRRLIVSGPLSVATCLDRRTVLLRDKIPSIETEDGLNCFCSRLITGYETH